MKNKKLIKIFKKIEKNLLSNVSNEFYSGVDFNSDNDVVNNFLARYIKLKLDCKRRIKKLSSYNLSNKVVVITGGSSGIGEQVAILCKKLKAKVIILDIKPPKIKNVKFIKCDVANKVDVADAFYSIEKLDYLVTSAGVFGFDENMSQLDKEKMFDINVEGTKNCIKQSFNKLLKSKGGICSITSGLCKTIDPTCLTYCITKQQIMKYLNTIKNKGVKINAVLPGPILTPLLLKDINTLKGLAEYCALNPEKYAGCPEDIALGVINLILTNANNTELAIDGGESKMFKKEDNKYWQETTKPLEVIIHGKKYVWKLDKSYLKNLKKADNDEELLQVLDEFGKPTGKLEKRGIVHKNKLFHNEVALWIIDKSSKKVLLQRRSPNKRRNPNKLAICAGHVVGNETLKQALIKEAKEELGLDIKNYKINKLITIKRTKPENNAFAHHYYICETIPIENIKIQKEELSEILYIDYEKLKQLIKQNNEEVAFKWEVYEPVFKKLDKIIK